MKIAISVPDDLFQEVERVADEEHLSRSRVFTEAIRDFLRRRRNRKLLAGLNEAYSASESQEEKDLRRQSRKYYARRVIREKW